MAEEEARGEETAGEEKEESPRMITGKGLAEAFADLDKLLKKFANTDCSTERFSVTERGMLSVRCLFLKREKPLAGPSGGASEEAIVIPRDDSSMGVIAPLTFQSHRMCRWETVTLVTRPHAAQAYVS